MPTLLHDLSAAKIMAKTNALLNKSATKKCILCAKKAIRAHSISKRKVLDKIACEGKVISTVYDMNEPGTISFGLVGTGKISTFSAFCAQHDQKLFKVLDENIFNGHNIEQESKMAFRAMARANWFNDMSYTANQSRIDAIAAKDYEFVIKYIGIPQIRQSHVFNWVKNRNTAIKELKDLSEIIAVLKHSLLTQNKLDGISTRTIMIPGEYPVAASAVGALNCDCINEEAYLPKYYSVSVFPENGKTYAVLSIPEAHGTCLDSVVLGAKTLGISDYRIVLTNILSQINTDAIAINPDYWENLNEDIRKEFVQTWTESSLDNKKRSVLETKNICIFDEKLL